ncbi:MAG: GlsB/YeaQ/YmgE family stress response membrane protein [Myxococcaceae bacterium]|nr:GlsB/YeaQ/YmgE family stress response membrane protein [Myxococcaceae bacterium]MCI0669838.1 GlsB/YeaQ/YmgE family stress response membrane protein [Myxococcaceae bacterium]
MGILTFIVIGVLAGLIARAVVPGRQQMGLLQTTLLGMTGSLLGGLISALFTHRRITDITSTGIIMSVVGAVAVLLLLGLARGGRRVHV